MVHSPEWILTECQMKACCLIQTYYLHKLDSTIKYTQDIQKRANNSKETECNALQHHIILCVCLCGWLFEQGGNGSSSLCNVNWVTWGWV